jgi:hypothetical protein
VTADRRLGLDSGFAARLLRSLEGQGLVASSRTRATGGCAGPG